jgi:hypothetical protein
VGPAEWKISRAVGVYRMRRPASEQRHDAADSREPRREETHTTAGGSVATRRSAAELRQFTPTRPSGATTGAVPHHASSGPASTAATSTRSTTIAITAATNSTQITESAGSAGELGDSTGAGLASGVPTTGAA